MHRAPENLSWRGSRHWLDWHPSAGRSSRKSKSRSAVVDQCGLKGCGTANPDFASRQEPVNLGGATAKTCASSSPSPNANRKVRGPPRAGIGFIGEFNAQNSVLKPTEAPMRRVMIGLAIPSAASREKLVAARWREPFVAADSGRRSR